PHGDVHGISPAGAGHGTVARSAESAGGEVAQPAGADECQLRTRPQFAGDHRCAAGELERTHSMRKILLIVAGTILLALPASAGDKNEVTIDNFSFLPQTLTVPAGTTVTWINRDDVPHTVVTAD